MAYRRTIRWSRISPVLLHCQTQVHHCCHLIKCRHYHIRRQMQPTPQRYPNHRLRCTVTSIHPHTRRQRTLAPPTIQMKKRIKNSIQSIPCSDGIHRIRLIIEREPRKKLDVQMSFGQRNFLCVSFIKCFEFCIRYNYYYYCNHFVITIYGHFGFVN